MPTIEDISDKQARIILHALCKDAEIESKATEYLESLHSHAKLTPDPQGTKRKAEEELEICVHCDAVFDMAENHDEACTWHQGDLDPDERCGFWDDYDEGLVDTEENREVYPDMFVWSCCGRLGDEDGCRPQAHEAVYKAARYRD